MKLSLDCHDITEAGDIAHFQVKAGKLGGVLVGKALFGAEHGADLKDAVKARGHGHLLIKLGALGKVCLAVEVLYLEYI